MNRDWYNLDPEKSTRNGYWDYYSVDPSTGRSTIAFHPGSISHGCITVPNQSCWNNLNNVLSSESSKTFTVTRYNKWWADRDYTISAIGFMSIS